MSPQRLTLKEAEAIAQRATRETLEALPKPDWHQNPNLTLGTFFPDDETYEFSLYLAGNRPSDAVVLTTATVNRLSGEVVVEIHAPTSSTEATDL